MISTFRNMSPFRYPGSKQALAPYVRSFLEANNIQAPHFYEPFAGGASLSLELLASNHIETTTLIERDPLVYSFWKCVRRHPAKLCDRLWKLNISINTWNKFQKYRAPGADSKFDLLDLAVAGIFFNRVNFSGVIGAKPIGGMSQSSDYAINCRWNTESLVDKICTIAKYGSRIRVCQGDAFSFLRRSKQRIAKQTKKGKALIYIDPPYYVQGWKLYRYFFEDQDHARLADYLDKLDTPWLCSYDDHPRIHELFAGPERKIVPINLQYTVRRNRRVNELLISNCKHLPDPSECPRLATVEDINRDRMQIALQA